MRLTFAALACLFCSACAGSRAATPPGADPRAVAAERDSLVTVSQTQREEIAVLADSLVALRRTNDALVRRRPSGTPPTGTAPPATPATRPPARPAPARPAPPETTQPVAPTVKADPTRADLPAEVFADTLTADELFLPASATLSPLGQAILDRVAFEIGRLPATTRLRVEGHGDNTPPGPSIKDRWPSNWELSSARAAAVIRYLTASGTLAAERFELAAFADTKPVAPNDTPQNRALNRRVIVVAREAPGR